MTPTRDLFVAHFGEEEAILCEVAIDDHAKEIPLDSKHGSDEFRWVLIRLIGFDCYGKLEPRRRKLHGFLATYEQFRAWAIAEAHLELFNGEPDYLAAILGIYNEYMSKGLIK